MKQLLPQLKRSRKPSEVVDPMLLDEVEERKSIFESAIKKTLAEEKFRFKTNFRIATTTTYISLFLILPFGLISWLMNLFGFVKASPINLLPWWLVIILWVLPYVSWHYTTITIPQKEGPVIKKDWSKTPKGRKRSALFNLAPFHVMCWAVFSKFVYENYFDYLTTLNVMESHKGILLTDNLNSFLLIIFFAPIIISALGVFVQARDYMINKDLLQDHFMDWQMPYFKRYAHEYKLESIDVIVGYESDTGKPIVIKENERFLHEAIIGATGSGKTSTTLLLRIAQDLIKIATGTKDMSMVLLEPKGDAVDDVLTICKKLGIPDEKIIVIDPFKEMSYKYNPFIGERNIVANTFQGTISALTGDQDQFFKDQQNEVCKNITLLAKIRYGNKTNIRIIQQLIDDPRELANVVEHVSAFIEQNRRNTNATPIQLKELDSYEVVVNYFINQVLDYKTFRDKDEIKPVPYPPNHRHHPEQMVENKKENYISGAKKYLNDLVNEDSLRALFTSGEGDRVFDADKVLSEGGIVLVNTALGELDELSMMFGQFFIRQFQAAVFRRAKENKEENIRRIPCIFYVDEFPLYANDAFQRFLTLGRSYKVGAVIAMQSIAQLDAVGTDYRKTVMGNASHKTVFGRGPVDDNEYFSKEFGEELRVEESVNESGAPMTTDNQNWGMRMNSQKKLMPRFTPTDIRELPFKQMIVQIVDERNSIAKPKHAIGEFVHESAFVQRFMKLVESDIKSTNEREINVVSAISNSKNYIGKSDGTMMDDATNEEANQALNEFVSESEVVTENQAESPNPSTHELDPIMVPVNTPQVAEPLVEHVEPVHSPKTEDAQKNSDDVFGGNEPSEEMSLNDFAVPADVVVLNDAVVVNEQPAAQKEMGSEPVQEVSPGHAIEAVMTTEQNDWLELLEEEEETTTETNPVGNDEIDFPVHGDLNEQEPTSTNEVPVFEETDLSIGFETTKDEFVPADEAPVFEETTLSIMVNEPSEPVVQEGMPSNDVPVFEETDLSIVNNVIVNDEPIYNEPVPVENVEHFPVFEKTDLSVGDIAPVQEPESALEQPTIQLNDISMPLSAVSQGVTTLNESEIQEEMPNFIDVTPVEPLPFTAEATALEQIPPSEESFVIEPQPFILEESTQQAFQTSVIDTHSSDMLDQLQKEVAASKEDPSLKVTEPIEEKPANEPPKAPDKPRIIELEI